MEVKSYTLSLNKGGGCCGYNGFVIFCDLGAIFEGARFSLFEDHDHSPSEDGGVTFIRSSIFLTFDHDLAELFIFLLFYLPLPKTLSKSLDNHFLSRSDSPFHDHTLSKARNKENTPTYTLTL